MATQAEGTARKIVGAVQKGTKVYTAGDEDALAALHLSDKDLNRLVAKGVLAGDWSDQPEPTSGAAGNNVGTPSGETEESPDSSEPAPAESADEAAPGSEEETKADTETEPDTKPAAKKRRAAKKTSNRRS